MSNPQIKEFAKAYSSRLRDDTIDVVDLESLKSDIVNQINEALLALQEIRAQSGVDFTIDLDVDLFVDEGGRWGSTHWGNGSNTLEVRKRGIGTPSYWQSSSAEC